MFSAMKTGMIRSITSLPRRSMCQVPACAKKSRESKKKDKKEKNHLTISTSDYLSGIGFAELEVRLAAAEKRAAEAEARAQKAESVIELSCSILSRTEELLKKTITISNNVRYIYSIDDQLIVSCLKFDHKK